MRIYVAAKFDKKDEVLKLFKILKESGHEVHSDWTTHKPIKPYEQNQKLAMQYSAEDIEGVKNCDVFIFLTDKEVSTGAHAELGAAILSHVKSGKPTIFVVGDHTNRSLFYFHPSVNRRDNINSVLEEIGKI